MANKYRHCGCPTGAWVKNITKPVSPYSKQEYFRKQGGWTESLNKLREEEKKYKKFIEKTPPLTFSFCCKDNNKKQIVSEIVKHSPGKMPEVVYREIDGKADYIKRKCWKEPLHKLNIEELVKELVNEFMTNGFSEKEEYIAKLIRNKLKI